jgi:hypothetical protein
MVELDNQKTERILLRTILQELQEGLRKLYGEDAPQIYLYGSYARDQQTRIRILISCLSTLEIFTLEKKSTASAPS